MARHPQRGLQRFEKALSRLWTCMATKAVSLIDQPGWIYVFREGDLWKIGRTNNLERRVREWWQVCPVVQRDWIRHSVWTLYRNCTESLIHLAIETVCISHPHFWYHELPKFAAMEDQVPNWPHLIVVPPSLVDQWAAKLKRFFRTDRIRLVVMLTRAVNWAHDMNNIHKSEGLAGVFVIVLVPSSGLKRMFTQSQSRIVFKECSTWINKVHDAQKGTPLWRSMRVVFEVTLVKVIMTAMPLMEVPKVIMTATPLMEVPPDFLHLARLPFPPTLTWPALAKLTALVQDLRLVKAKTNADIYQSVIKLAAKDKIVAAGSGLASATLATQLVTMFQRHLIPYTIRRGPESHNWEGKPLNTQLPP
ncbi:hypothetical protein D9757_014618 [Collybiopsis confluens]|uniref:Bacteriophage T5 Orf172 DNA-binding domain-containing protein n=1 Tax=Collybiopsis confluens TaxID=2823264 RepID=A0A8H5D8A4_9AGAR|nr:hypothetical protein D9757_014618 [Collybiopsis confluens]